MSAASRESPRGDTDRQASSQNVVIPVVQRSQALHSIDEPGELSGGGELHQINTCSTRYLAKHVPTASSQRTTRQSDLAPSLAAWDTRTHEPEAPDSSIAAPPADFKPFFALVEDPVTGEYHHPEVHYIFSDDEDQGVLTSAALRAIDKEDNTLQEHDDVEERVAVIDMDFDGRTVLGISSLSPEWQALRAQVWEAPGQANKKQGNTDRGLMLRVSGKEASVASATGKQNDDGVENLVKNFGNALESLDEVLGEEEAKAQDDGSNVIQTQRPGSGAQ